MAKAKKKGAKKKLKIKKGESRRTVMFAPWRHGYVSKTAKDEGGDCVFCDALKIGVSLKSLIVFKGETCSVILNKYPYNNGHTMVIPHRHTGDFDKLQGAEFEELHRLLQKTYAVLLQAYGPHGMNIGMNLGRSGGAGVLGHLHYHLVPRWNGDTNFMPVVAQTKVISEGLEETYQKLVALF